MKTSSLVLFTVLVVVIQNLQAETLDRMKVESQLANATMELISMQEYLIKNLTFCGLQTKFCSSNLKASNLPKNFTDVLDNMQEFVKGAQTFVDHQLMDLPLSNISTYDYCQFLIMKTFSDIRYFKSIIRSIEANESKLYEFETNLTTHYVKNYMTFVKLKSKDMTVMATIRQVLHVFRVFGRYIKLLTAQIGNHMKLNSFLSGLITRKIFVPPTATTSCPFMLKVLDIESQLIPHEKQIQSLIQFDLDLIEIAEKTVTSRVKRASKTEKKDLMELKNTFGVISSLNDYSLLGWPKLPDLPADGSSMMMKVRSSACDTKEMDFMEIQDCAMTNLSLVTTAREELNASSLTVSTSFSERKVQAQSQPIKDVIDATLNVEKAYKNYTLKLDWAIAEIRKLRETLNVTTVEGTCGSFVTSSTTKNPATLGIIAGNTYDNIPIYVGTSNHTGLNVIKCPGRLSPGSFKAYMLTSNTEILSAQTASFLRSHSLFTWIPANGLTAFTHPDSIKWSTDTYPMTYGRKVMSGYTVVGYVLYGGTYNGLYYYDSFLKSGGRADDFEVIGCKTTPKTCGKSSPYIQSIAQWYPVLYGVLAGVDKNKKAIYVGLVYNACGDLVNLPAKITIDKSNYGTYFACDSSSISETPATNISIPYYLDNHPSISWKNTTANTLSTSGIYTYVSGGKTLGFGRQKITFYTVIGKVVVNEGVKNGFYGFNPVTLKYYFLPATTQFEVISCI